MPGRQMTGFLHDMCSSFMRDGAVCIACTTSDAPPSLLEDARATLSAPEAVRLDTMRAPGKRAEFLLSRLVLKSVARALFGGEHNEITLTRDAKGAFIIEGTGEPGIHASLSHCPGALALMFARESRVGVDIEPERRVTRAVARRFFSSREFEETARGANPQGELTTRWTLKEAFAKASGVPLLRALHGAEFVREDAGYRLRESIDGCGTEWSFLSAAAAGGFRLAAARRGTVMPVLVECGDASLLAGLLG